VSYGPGNMVNALTILDITVEVHKKYWNYSRSMLRE
jgi:hypothetical protein